MGSTKCSIALAKYSARTDIDSVGGTRVMITLQPKTVKNVEDQIYPNLRDLFVFLSSNQIVIVYQNLIIRDRVLCKVSDDLILIFNPTYLSEV